MLESFKFGKHASKVLSNLFPEPIKMEFEKVYATFLLMNKKRYAGLIYKELNDIGKLDIKGIECVRRDNFLLLRQMQKELLNILLKNDSNLEIPELKRKIVVYINKKLENLTNGRVGMAHLIASSTISKSRYMIKEIEDNAKKKKEDKLQS